MTGHGYRLPFRNHGRCDRHKKVCRRWMQECQFREGLAAMLSKADVGSGPPDGQEMTPRRRWD